MKSFALAIRLFRLKERESERSRQSSGKGEEPGLREAGEAGLCVFFFFGSSGKDRVALKEPGANRTE